MPPLNTPSSQSFDWEQLDCSVRHTCTAKIAAIGAPLAPILGKCLPYSCQDATMVHAIKENNIPALQRALDAKPSPCFKMLHPDVDALLDGMSERDPQVREAEAEIARAEARHGVGALRRAFEALDSREVPLLRDRGRRIAVPLADAEDRDARLRGVLGLVWGCLLLLGHPMGVVSCRGIEVGQPEEDVAGFVWREHGTIPRHRATTLQDHGTCVVVP